MAKKKVTEAPLIEPGAQYEQAPVVEAVEDEAPAREGMEMVRIKIPVQLKIKRKLYAPGVHTVPFHVAQTMSEMVDKKRRADMSIFVGKNVLVERLLDRTLIQTEVESLDMKKIVNK